MTWAGPLARLDVPSRMRLLALIATIMAVCVLLGVHALTRKSHDGYVLAVLVHGLVYVVGVWVVLTVGLGRRALLAILLVAALLRLLAFQVPVGITTDAYRYVWDGRLQAAGVNPYLTVPADPRLAHLRDTAIYPNINGPEVYPTIYPPSAQIAFLVATRIHDSIDGIKILMALAEAGIIAALIGWLSALGLARERVLIYAWHPLPLWELTGHGHIDALAVLFVTLAMLAAARGRTGWIGAAFAAAALVKYWPAYLAAAVWRRWDWRPIAAALLTIGLLYVPYILPGLYGFGFEGVPAPQVLGSLFKHLDAEGYNHEGWGFFLAYAPKHFGWFDIGGAVYGRLAALVLVGFGAWIAWQRKPAVPPTWMPVALVTALLLLISPHYPWYYAMAVPLLAVCMYPPTLFVTIVISMIYIEIDYRWLTPYPRFWVYCIAYVGFVVLAGLAWWLPRRRSRLETTGT